MAVVALAAWDLPVEGRAAGQQPWNVREVPVSVRPGDQVRPSLAGGTAVWLDQAVSPAGVMMQRMIEGATELPLPFAADVQTGPVADAAAVLWQRPDGQACMASLAGTGSSCLALPAAEVIAFSGDKAVSSHQNSVIRLINFETMRTRILDSSTASGGRYDPDIEGDRAVWVRERGYAGKYYEPVIISHDLLTDTNTYMTRLGGGANANGESVYERRHPSLSNGRILYQQRLRGTGNRWDIYEAVPDSFGLPVVEAAGDQVNPSLSGNLVVYQDNRTGHLNEQGEWVGEWDIYMKDLDRGIEIPVCTAAGDQINPVIVGNNIVWEDNRNGDWDIYGAVITQAVSQPRLTLSSGGAYWRSYAAYLNGELTVKYIVGNDGEGSAWNITAQRVITTPDVVTVCGWPQPVLVLEPGWSAFLETRFALPAGMQRFRTRLYVSATDDAGREVWFPGLPPAP
ncbi:MAG: hypothetical protein ACYCXF_04310 [Thermoleophilia bacterium]